MTILQPFPFRRIVTDHLIEGGSRIWWSLVSTFRDAGPLTFQVQAGKTALPTATDWVDVGSPVTDGFLAVDSEKRLYGKRLETHYRIVLTDSAGQQYVSHPEPVEGFLDEKSWVTAREMVRKFELIDRFISTEGWLLKRRRYGPPCTRCLDPLSNTITDSKCPLCRGTGYLVGYHPPVRLCLKMEPQTIQELRNGAQPPGQTQYNTILTHVLAFPQLALEDIWIADHSDLRFAIDVIKHSAIIKSVPLISDVTMHQLPFTDIAYRIPVGDQPDDQLLGELPTAGTGSETVTHDYGGPDALAYQLPDGCGIEGATILAFRKADYDAGIRSPSLAIAATTTSANGRWEYALKLDPGEYILVAQKVGEYGPNASDLTVIASQQTVASSSSSANSFGAF
jgi:hypothetical protein